MDNITIIQKQLTDTRLTPEERSSLEAQAGAESLPISSGGPPTGPRLRWLKMATSDVDRAGDIMLLGGMDATNFLKNPQYLWQHGMSGATVSTIGSIRKLVATDTALFALAEYATEDISPLAEQIFQLDIAGFLPANSIGFRPIEWEANETGGHTFTKWELVECSKVELPMNPNAVGGKQLNLNQSLDYADSWLASSTLHSY